MEEKKYTLKELADAYSEGKPLVSDKEYEKLTEGISHIIEVQEGQLGKGKMEHFVPMMSIQKITLGKLGKYLPKIGGEIIIQPKYDGVAFSLDSTHGFLTRGNGVLGEQIGLEERAQKLIKTLSADDKKLFDDDNLIIRGEIYVDSKLLGVDEVSRAVTTGILRKLERTMEDVNKLTFLPYEIIRYTDGEWITSSEGLSFTFENGMESKDYIIEILSFLQTQSFPTDGVVIKSERSKFQVHSKYRSNAYAIKHEEYQEYKESIITEIEWNLSSLGKLIPTLIFNSVKIQKTQISRATGVSLKYLRSMHLGIGTKIKVVKCGGIIPKVERLYPLEDTTEEFTGDCDEPIFCPFCETKLVMGTQTLLCCNVECPERMRKFIVGYLRHIGAKALPRNFNSLLEADNLDFYSFFVRYCDGRYQGAGAIEFKKCLDTRRKTNSVVSFFGGLPFESIGEKLIEKWISEEEMTADDLINRLQGIAWTHIKTSQDDFVLMKLIDYSTCLINFASDLYYESVAEFSLESGLGEVSSVFKGMTILITGVFSESREEMANFIEMRGGVAIKNHYKRSVTHLLVGEKAGAKKLSLIQDKGIISLTEEDLYRMANGRV